MKKLSIYAMAIFFIATMLMSCGGNKQVATTSSPTTGGVKRTLGPTIALPCADYDKDTDEKFSGIGIARGSYKSLGKVKNNSLKNAQDEVALKFKHVYAGVLLDYSNVYQDSDIESKMEQAGKRIMKVILDHSKIVCGPEADEFPDDEGCVNVYCAIEINKTEVSQKVTEEVKKVLSDEDKLKIDFDEDKFYKKLDERLKNYQEEN